MSIRINRNGLRKTGRLKKPSSISCRYRKLPYVQITFLYSKSFQSPPPPPPPAAYAAGGRRITRNSNSGTEWFRSTGRVVSTSRIDHGGPAALAPSRAAKAHNRRSISLARTRSGSIHVSNLLIFVSYHCTVLASITDIDHNIPACTRHACCAFPCNSDTGTKITTVLTTGSIWLEYQRIPAPATNHCLPAHHQKYSNLTHCKHVATDVKSYFIFLDKNGFLFYRFKLFFTFSAILCI